MKLSTILFVLVGLLLVGGCSPIVGQQVLVPPAYVGKILTRDGYKPNTVTPSRFRLERCWAYCDSLILLEVSDKSYKESFKLFMPKDQLNVQFDVRMVLTVNRKAINNIFDRVSPDNGVIPFTQLYNTYAKPVIRDVVRQVVAKYTINEVASSRERISEELFVQVEQSLKGTAIKIKRFGLAEVQFPDVITTAKENAAKRREEIEQEKAIFEKQKIVMERQLEEAKMQRAIEREKAQGTKEVNNILSTSVNDKYLAYRGLEVLEKMAQSSNKVFVPVEALGTVGLQQALFKDTVANIAKKGG